ncbi:hypothetical protein [Streptomyces clavifer]|uniref:hypothetical protein n=1 Tax=Streptomyces clavifer TaxID=68188 RepID=UPI00308F4131|nr:hypothetical protein OG388_19400 [Streptomyces clavifer]
MSDVLIRRGISGLPRVPRKGDRGNYPYEAISVAKVLRAAGVTVEFEDAKPERDYHTHDSADIWLPVIEFATDIGKDLIVVAATAMITRYIVKRPGDANPSALEEVTPPPVILHLEVIREGDQTNLRLDGPPEAVLKAFKEIDWHGGGDARGQLPDD